MLPSFQTINLQDRILQKLQDNIRQVFTAIDQVGIVQGALVTYTVPTGGLTAGATFVVNHGLGQAAKAVFPALLAGITSSFSVSTATNPAPTTTVLLTTSAALAQGLTLYFWVI